jgi:hypothetical protein
MSFLSNFIKKVFTGGPSRPAQQPQAQAARVAPRASVNVASSTSNSNRSAELEANRRRASQVGLGTLFTGGGLGDGSDTVAQIIKRVTLGA